MKGSALQVALLLVVAGYQHLDSLADVSADGLRQHFEVNSIGPLMAVQALRPWLVSGTKVRDWISCNLHEIGTQQCPIVAAACGRALKHTGSPKSPPGAPSPGALSNPLVACGAAPTLSTCS